MARPLRIEISDALYHVTSRGNARQDVFRDERDFQRRIDWLRRTVETYGWHVHAFVLMNNHDHLFVETPRANLAAGMHYLNGSYTSYFNRRHRQVGHLFQGRYKSVLIENEGHYWEVSRYIHLNPVRARLVQRPEQWPWSSYGGYYMARRCLPWVTYDRVLGEFGRNEQAARRAYRRFVAAGLEEPLDSPLSKAVHGLVLGSEAFLARAQGIVAKRPKDPGLPALRRMRAVPTVERVIEVTAKHFGRDGKQWIRGRRDDSIARAVAAWLARCRFGHSASETARLLGYSGASSVSQAIRRIDQQRSRLKSVLTKLERHLAEG